MWWVGSRHQIYLSASSAWVHRPESDDVWISAEGWGAALDMLDALGEQALPARRRAAITFVLGAGLARPFLLEGISGVDSAFEARELAMRMAPDATGLTGPCAVSLHDWRRDTPCLATAVEQALIDRLVAWTRARRFRLTSIRPWWIQAVNQLLARPQRPSVAGMVCDDGLIMLGGFDTPQTTTIGYYPRPTVEQCSAIIERVAQAHECAAGDVPIATWGRRKSAETSRGAVGEVRWAGGAP